MTAAKKKNLGEKPAKNADDSVNTEPSVVDKNAKQDNSCSCAGNINSQKEVLSLEELSEKLIKVENEKEELNDKILRARAEFENYKKRVLREKNDLLKYGTEKFALELLPVADNFERALEQAKDADNTESVVDGIEMILKQFINTLEKFHIKSFDSVRLPFDPEKHEAMTQQVHDKYEDNTVIEEFHKGYSIGNKLLRPARVIVSKKPPQKEEKSVDN